MVHLNNAVLSFHCFIAFGIFQEAVIMHAVGGPRNIMARIFNTQLQAHARE